MVSWCSGTGGRCSMDYIHFRFEYILFSHGDDDIGVKWDSLPERGLVVGGEEGYDRGWGHSNDDIKCL